jgi:putative OPT family oligopeptide transporter
MAEGFQPHVSPLENPPELTFRAVLIGVFLGSLFAAANAYVGLKVGLTVSASIPVAVVSMAILRALKNGSILENNMAQTVGSAGESLAAGIIFTIPALYLWGEAPPMSKVLITTLLGGTLGVLFMIPLRRFLIVQEHDNLPYPEGTACAEVLKAGESGGDSAHKVFLGLACGALYASAFKIFGVIRDGLSATISLGAYRTVVAIDAIPSLLGVGYILGIRVAGMMLAGGALGWLVLAPLLWFVGDNMEGFLPPADKAISAMNAGELRGNYIAFIGAGAVTVGGLVSLAKTLLRFAASLRAGMARSAEKNPTAPPMDRTQLDLAWKPVVLIGIACTFALWGLGIVSSFWGALAILVFSGIFVAVSSQIVGLVGASSNPVSGMTITTLIGTSLLFLALGAGGTAGMVQAISVGAVVCIAACMAGDTSQDLKTGYLLGATPRRQQIGELAGTFATAIALSAMIPFIIMLPTESGPVLNIVGADPGVASAANPEFLAPQANVMKTIVEGIFNQDLPWVLLIIGGALALVVELLGAPSLPFAVGLYLPFSLSAAVFSGGLLRTLAGKVFGNKNSEKGILMASGLIAGEALLGLGWIGAIWTSSKFGDGGISNQSIWDSPAGADAYTMIAFAGLAFLLFRTAAPKKNS